MITEFLSYTELKKGLQNVLYQSDVKIINKLLLNSACTSIFDEQDKEEADQNWELLTELFHCAVLHDYKIVEDTISIGLNKQVSLTPWNDQSLIFSACIKVSKIYADQGLYEKSIKMIPYGLINSMLNNYQRQLVYIINKQISENKIDASLETYTKLKDFKLGIVDYSDVVFIQLVNAVLSNTDKTVSDRSIQAMSIIEQSGSGITDTLYEEVAIFLAINGFLAGAKKIVETYLKNSSRISFFEKTSKKTQVYKNILTESMLRKVDVAQIKVIRSWHKCLKNYDPRKSHLDRFIAQSLKNDDLIEAKALIEGMKEYKNKNRQWINYSQACARLGRFDEAFECESFLDPMGDLKRLQDEIRAKVAEHQARFGLYEESIQTAKSVFYDKKGFTIQKIAEIALEKGEDHFVLEIFNEMDQSIRDELCINIAKVQAEDGRYEDAYKIYSLTRFSFTHVNILAEIGAFQVKRRQPNDLLKTINKVEASQRTQLYLGILKKTYEF